MLEGLDTRRGDIDRLDVVLVGEELREVIARFGDVIDNEDPDRG